MNHSTPAFRFVKELSETVPHAVALISGDTSYPDLEGTVKFYQTSYIGLLIETEIFGLPYDPSGTRFLAMHIHQFGNCTPPFDKTGEHYNPTNLPHPQHDGDLLPLLSNYGYAWSVFYDERLILNEILGRSVIIHHNPDDFTTQPSGNAGEKIGCGIIQLVQR